MAVGADPDRIALLDNFCWGNTERPETLGSLVRAAQGCHDLALAYGTPFISGKDSLNNEYTHEGTSLAIPPTLLISAMGQVPDVRRCVTMDLKEAGNLLLLVGMTRIELGGSHWADGRGTGRRPGPAGRPRARPVDSSARSTPRSAAGLVRGCHDLSEGGLAVALAEMALAGGLGRRRLARRRPPRRGRGARRGPAVLGIAHAIPPRGPPGARRRAERDSSTVSRSAGSATVVEPPADAMVPSAAPRLTVTGNSTSSAVIERARSPNLKAAWQTARSAGEADETWTAPGGRRRCN